MIAARPPADDAPRRRCRPRPRQTGGLRPTDVVGAFFVAGIAFLAAGTIVAIVDAASPWPWGRWLALHLAFVGGVSQLILGASQFFAGAFLATDPPPRPLIRAQLACWNAGAIALAVAVPSSAHLLVDLAVLLLLAGLACYVGAHAKIRRRSLRVASFATLWYRTGAVFLALGIVAGTALAQGASWAHGDLLGAHMALNLAGWFGAAILGTLHTFYPSLTQTRLRHPRLERWTYAPWVAGVFALAVGYAWSVDLLAIVGWLALALAAVLLALNVVGCLRAAQRPLSLAARLLAVAQVFLLAGVLLAAATALADGPAHALAGSTRAAVATLLVAGWVGITVLGSLLHLLAVVIRVRDFTQPLPAPRPVLDIALTALAGGGIAALALAQAAGVDQIAIFAAGALAAYAMLMGRVARLAGRVLIRARPSI